MIMSTPNPIEVAGAPALIAILQAVQQFNVDMGPDPAKWLLNFPGAQLKMMGSIQLQLPALATAEGALAQSTLNGVLAGWISKLQALVPAK